MLKNFFKRYVVIGSMMVMGFSFLFYYFFATQGCLMANEVHSVEDVIKVFPKSVQQIKACSQEAQDIFKKKIDEIVALKPEVYSYENVPGAFDKAMVQICVPLASIYIIQMTHPDDQVRDAAEKEYIELEKCILKHAHHNVDLYKVIRRYHEEVEDQEFLSDEQKFYIVKLLKDFHRQGIDLPEEKRKLVESLEKEIAQLSSEFEKNIASDSRTIKVKKQELKGLSEDFIGGLEKNENGDYILGVDYPTYFTVMDFCAVSKTRKALRTAFINRANPANIPILNEILKKRYELAQILGYKNFAQFQIADEMAQTPERVQAFLDNLIKKSTIKAQHEFNAMIDVLPESVELSDEGKVYPWDIGYLLQSYKKKHIAIDEEQLAEYFPLDYTLSQLLDIYTHFLGIAFEEVSLKVGDLWHEDVKLIEARLQETNEVIGYIILDLFPRPHKFTHAANSGVVPALSKGDGSKAIGLTVLLANFPKASPSKPALLKRDDVKTFFHEFGHALHELLAATQTGYFAGTHVKTDFVEMPSQMLEEWMWDPEILKKVSRHYKTGEPLSDELITKILKIKHLESGYWVLRQCVFSQLSLDAYRGGGQDDMYQLNQKIIERLLSFVEVDPENHMYLSFSHLPGYGSRYYGYLWSKVFALDLFYYIKQYGLLNREIGRRYVDEVLSKGGSIDPNILLETFLGREPNDQAFFKDLGL